MGVAKTSDQIDSFPDFSNSDEISSFCLPNGASVRFIPKCTLKNAYKIGWVGEKLDRYQLHVFTDVSGERTFGISITVIVVCESLGKNFWILHFAGETVRTNSNFEISKCRGENI